MNVSTAARSCRHCPMCHHADLTVTLERRETYSARGRGLTVFAIEKGKQDWDADVAEVMYRFFADGLNRHVCEGHIAHDDMVIEARRQLLFRGQAPQIVSRIRANIESTGNAWGEPEPNLLTLSGASMRSDVLIYFGPSARIRRSSVITALARLLARAGATFMVLAQEADPGLLLYQLGDEASGTQAARELTRKIAQSGARVVITPDADAYRVLKTGFGAAPPLAGVDVWHASQFLLKHADRFNFRGLGRSRVVYHDPCALARFSPCLDAPRALIRAAGGDDPLEIDLWNRELANCSGECGGVPFTFPSLARKAAERRILEARATGAELLVTAGAASAEALEDAVLPVLELCEFVSQSLE